MKKSRGFCDLYSFCFVCGTLDLYLINSTFRSNLCCFILYCRKNQFCDPVLCNEKSSTVSQAIFAGLHEFILKLHEFVVDCCHNENKK